MVTKARRRRQSGVPLAGNAEKTEEEGGKQRRGGEALTGRGGSRFNNTHNMPGVPRIRNSEPLTRGATRAETPWRAWCLGS